MVGGAGRVRGKLGFGSGNWLPSTQHFASGSDPIHVVVPGVLRAASLGRLPDIHQVSIFPFFLSCVNSLAVSPCAEHKLTT